MVQFIQDHREQVFQVSENDDVAIGAVLTKAGFPRSHAHRLNLTSDTWVEPTHEYHIRLRNNGRRMDCEIEFRKRLIALDTNPRSQ